MCMQCHCATVTILGQEGVPVHVDGEAWIQPPSIIRIFGIRRELRCSSETRYITFSVHRLTTSELASYVKLACHQQLSRVKPHQNFVLLLCCFVPYRPYAQLCAILFVADSDIMPCVHCRILGVSLLTMNFHKGDAL